MRSKIYFFSKLLFLILFININVSANISAQNKAAYMIPDIGTPGMNVYIEIIAHVDSVGAFGDDGNFLQSPALDRFYLKTINADDEWKLIFGPLSVSWHGRLISSQIFVNPYLEPQSWRWDEGLHIPIGLYENGNLVNTFNFYVVLPCPLGDISKSSGFILGEPPLGLRSPRGAMIVDSLIFDDRMYLISKEDCDINTPGNQGYLPFTILSMGNIKSGIKLNTNISVAAYKQDGGVGGGGGGGAFCDNNENIKLEDSILRGGNGFTGGGVGGINNKGILGTVRYSTLGGGTGSGSIDSSLVSIPQSAVNHAGNSLNGVKGVSREGYEATGGGTGHPFGKSGVGSWNDDREGGYGGGSGSKDRERGGIAAYGTNCSGATQRDGKIHGNKMLIPLAGGSGGAGGNPKPDGGFSIKDACSGYGGGAGGAITIFARLNNENFSINARGANGRQCTNNAGNSNGGSGSGGGIIVSSKVKSTVGLLDVTGGINGNDTAGFGYVRIESVDDPVYIKCPVTPFSIITTDTSSYVNKTKTLNLTGSGSGDLYYRRLNENEWKFLGSVYGRNWTYTINDNIFRYDGDTLFYIVAVQTNKRVSGTYVDEPSHLMAQAGANVLKVEKTPYISYDKDSVLKYRILNCEDNVISFDITKIYNIGDDDLIIWNDKINSTLSFGKANIVMGSSVERDQNNNYIIPTKLRLENTEQAFLDVKITYTIPNNLSPGIYNDTLVIWHNDSLRENPCIFPIELEVYNIETQVLNRVLEEISIINLGTYCRNEEVNYSTSFMLKNNSSEISLDLLEVFVTDPDIICNVEYGVIDPLALKDINIRLVNVNKPAGFYKAYCIAKYKECGTYLDTLLVIEYSIVETKLSFDKNPLIFSEVYVGNDTSIVVTIRNESSYQVEIRQEHFSFADGSNFFISNITPSLPILMKIGGTIDVVITFRPIIGSKNIKDTLFINIPIGESYIRCRGEAILPIQGESVKFSLYADKSKIDFGIIECEDKKDSVWIINEHKSEQNFKIIVPAHIENETIKGAYKIIEQPKDDIVLEPGDSVLYVVSTNYDIENVGNYNLDGYLCVNSNGGKICVALSYGIDKDIELSRDNINVGTIPLGSSKVEVFTIKNIGKLDKEITNISFNNSKVDYSFEPALPIIIPANESVEIKVTITPKIDSEVGIFQDSFMVSTKCNDYKGIIFGNIIQSDIYFETVIFEPLAAKCNNFNTKDAVIINRGETEVTIRKVIGIEGIDKDLFEVFEVGDINIVLNKGEQFDVVVMFKSKGATVGEKYATLLVEVFADGKVDTIQIPLKGTINMGLLVTPDEMDFKDIPFCGVTEKSMEIKLDNLGDYSLIIDNIYLKNSNNGFAVANNLAGISLDIGKYVYVKVNFVAQALGEKFDTLYIAFEYEDTDKCKDTIKVLLYANVIPCDKITLRVSKNYNVSPNTTNYKIPIFVTITPNIIDNFIIDKLVLEHNRTLFYPKAVSNGDISISIDNNDFNKRIITLSNIQLNNLQPDKEVKLCELSGDVLLGEVDSTEIDIKDIVLHSSLLMSDISIENGYLTIDICRQGGDRLISYTASNQIKVINNPVINDVLDIECNMIEVGNYNLSIIDYLGNKVIVKEWNINEFPKNMNFNIPVNDFTVGAYILVLNTPSKQYSTNFIIMK